MILEEIVKRKRERLKKTPFLQKEEYVERIKSLPPPNSFYERMKKPGLSIIGEVKKASPSKGVIKEQFNPREIAREYEKAVDAISVLTEEDFFMGSADYLQQVKEESTLPILRKDFILEENQIYESRILGASAVLLITAILEERILKRLIETAHTIQLDALVEVHSEEEVEIAVRSGARIIGINNRNLKDFSVDLDTTLKLKQAIPGEIIVISESGIHGPKEIEKLRAVQGVLIGESFMRCEDIVKKAKEMRKAYGKSAD